MTLTVEEFKARFGVTRATTDEAASTQSSAKQWNEIHPRLGELYAEAMASDPVDRTKLESAWAMSVEKADSGEFDAAIKIAKRLAPQLRAAMRASSISGKSATQEAIPKDVVAFQSARVLWVDTRAKMKQELRKLEDAIIAACNLDEDLAPVADSARQLSERLEVFDTRLENTLEQITVTAAGPDRESLKSRAKTEIADYLTAMSDEFFTDVDTDNGFTNVAVASAARESLDSIARTLG